MVRNTTLPEHRRMEFRIGINLGDVIEEKETIYGDGVNIAARLESLAEGGEICISEKVYGEVKKKLSLEYKDIGEHSVKNIDEPVRAYRVLVESGVTVRKVSREKKAWLRRWQKVALVVLAILVVGSVALAVWNPDPREVSPRMFVFFLLTFGFRYFFASISLYP
jgi:adenylate cyclase